MVDGVRSQPFHLHPELGDRAASTKVRVDRACLQKASDKFTENRPWTSIIHASNAPLASLRAEDIRVVSIETTNELTTVYNLEAARAHTFFVGEGAI